MAHKIWVNLLSDNSLVPGVMKLSSHQMNALITNNVLQNEIQ